MVGNLALANVENIQKVQETPVKWCAVSLSEVVNRGKRFDASVFDVDAKIAYQTLEKCKYDKCTLFSKGFVTSAYYGNRLKRKYISKNDSDAIGFIGSSEMLNINPKPIKFMKDSHDIDDLRVKKGTVLISRSGTIGNLSFVNETLSKLLISEHAIRLECDKNAGFVYCYLKTHIGQVLIHSKIYGAVVQQIEPEHLSSIPIPNPSIDIKDQINDLIERSYSLRDESNKLLDKADCLLKSELQLSPIQKLKVTRYQDAASVDTFSVKLSNLQGRIDASYHVPIVNAIVKHIQKYAAEVTTVGDSRISKKIILPGRFKRIYVDENHGRIFIGGKQLGELDPSNKKYLSITHHEKRIKEQLELHENMILITCSGTIGKVALVPRHWEKWTANQHIIRVVPTSSEIAGYLSVFLASDYGYPLITRYTYGSVVDEIDDTQVAGIPVPLLKNKVSQTKINDLALQANEKRYQAYKLEQQALRIMDKDVIYAK